MRKIKAGTCGLSRPSSGRHGTHGTFRRLPHMTSPQLAGRQEQLVHLVRRVLGIDPGVPRWKARLLRRVERLQRLPHLIDLVVEKVSDEQVSDLAAQVGKLLDEPTETEAIVVLAYQPPHAV